MGRKGKTATTEKSLPLPRPLQVLAAWIGMWAGEHQARVIEYQRAENAALLERLGKHRLRLTDGERRRLAKLGKVLGRKALQEVATIATPDTILRWYRELVAVKYDGSKKRAPGRPKKAAEIVRLLLEMATLNTTWGYTRLRDALNNLGYDIGRTTVQRILAEHGIEPAPQRKRQYSWATFIKAHLGAIAGMDFFTVEVLTVVGLVRYHVLFVIDIGSRIVEVVGLARDPDGDWMRQMARNLVDADEGFLRGKRYLILDRDPLYTKELREMLKGAGVKPLLLPARSPNLNAYSERFVLSIKSECLDRIVPLGEAHLRRAIREYLVHYHGERNHQGSCQRIPHGSSAAGQHERFRTSTRASRRPAELLPPWRGLTVASIVFWDMTGRNIGPPLHREERQHHV